MSDQKIVTVVGNCAGHPQHPELLWVFEQVSGSQLRLLKVETDFPPPPTPPAKFAFQKFYVDMGNWERCPYCEAKLYFFCKQCHSLNCFAWHQVDEEDQGWNCPTCETRYQMRPKTSPFQVSAAVEHGGQTSKTNTNLDLSSLSINGGPNPTQSWHPSKK
jgi:uncharacterized Zn-finger protein